MLILTRRKNEAFIINDNIKVICLGLNSHGQYKFGIEAPLEITVHREEVVERIKAGIAHEPKDKGS